MLKYILTPDGECEPVDLLKWAEWFERADRKIGSDQIGESHISTVFLGLDHSFRSGPPLLFETMVFGGPLDGEQKRYTTKAEALAGHATMIEKVKVAARGGA